jgi:hypothetical protein
MKTRAKGTRTGLALAAAVLAGRAVAAAQQPAVLTLGGPAAAPPGATAPGGPALEEVRWLGLDPQGRRIALVSAEGAGAQVLLMSPEGRLLRRYGLPRLEAEAFEVHHFPRAGQAVIVAFTDAAEPDADSVAEAEEPAADSGRVWLLDLELGGLRELAGVTNAAFADAERDRLFLVRGPVLRVVDAATGRTVAIRRFVGNIGNLVIGASGQVHLLQAGPGSVPARLVSLAPPLYKVVRKRALSRPAPWQTLLGVDEARNRALVRDEAEGDLESEHESPSILVEELRPQGRGLVLAGPSGPDSRLFGPFGGGRTFALHDSGSGLLCIYDAESLGLVRTLQGFHGQLVGVEPGGTLLVSSGRTIERRDPDTFEVLQSVELNGFVHRVVFDGKAGQVHAVVEAGAGHGVSSHRLVHLDLERLQPVL